MTAPVNLLWVQVNCLTVISTRWNSAWPTDLISKYNPLLLPIAHGQCMKDAISLQWKYKDLLQVDLAEWTSDISCLTFKYRIMYFLYLFILCTASPCVPLEQYIWVHCACAYARVSVCVRACECVRTRVWVSAYARVSVCARVCACVISLTVYLVQRDLQGWWMLSHPHSEFLFKLKGFHSLGPGAGFYAFLKVKMYQASLKGVLSENDVSKHIPPINMQGYVKDIWLLFPRHSKQWWRFDWTRHLEWAVGRLQMLIDVQ